MTAEAIDKAADILLIARRLGEVLPGLPDDCAPADLEGAYAVQAALFERLGGRRAGFFVGCSNPVIQKQLGLPAPYRAPLLVETLHDSPLTIPAAHFPNLTLEVEFAFRLGRDLPPRDRPYEQEEVAAAVASLHPSIEIVASHLEDWTHQPIWSIIADNGTDGGLVVGTGREDWLSLDRPAIAVTLFLNGEEVRQGSGADVLGDPLTVFTWLVNACGRDGVALRAGEICNTGSCTPMIAAAPGDHALARFEGLGEAEVTFTTDA